MAKTAEKAAVQAAEAGPDYTSAIDAIRGRIADLKQQQSTAGGHASKEWEKIEKVYGVNRKGAQIFATIDAIKEGNRPDVVRTLLSMIAAAGYDEFDDLVDQMFGDPQDDQPKTDGAAAPIPDVGVDDFDEASDEEVAAQEARPTPAETQKRLEQEKADGMNREMAARAKANPDALDKELQRATQMSDDELDQLNVKMGGKPRGGGKPRLGLVH